MGHPSVRIPGTDHVLIKPRHSLRIRAMGRVKPEDMVIIDTKGERVRGERKASSEIAMHLLIYEMRPDTHAVVHAHYAGCGVALGERQPIFDRSGA